MLAPIHRGYRGLRRWGAKHVSNNFRHGKILLQSKHDTDDLIAYTAKKKPSSISVVAHARVLNFNLADDVAVAC